MTPNLRLCPLTLGYAQAVREWRDDDACRAGLRRPEPLTKERQETWYREVVCRPESSRHRYWAVEMPPDPTRIDREDSYQLIVELSRPRFVGQVSLENIDPRVKAEIGLITNPAMRGKGVGREALRLLLARGFDEYGLRRVWGVVYRSNPAIKFWFKMLQEFNGFAMTDDDWTETNIWGGQEHPAMRFWFTAEAWREMRGGKAA